MILIMSQFNDTSTINVIKWLNFYGAQYVRIDQERVYGLDYLEIKENVEIVCRLKDIESEAIIDFDKINAYWYRRGHIRLVMPKLDKISDSMLREKLYSFLASENMKLQEYLYYVLAKKHHVNRYENRNLNKLQVLSLAAKYGLKIPLTKVIGNSDTIKDKNYITKAISDPFHFYIENKRFVTYTEKAEWKLWPPNYFPTLVQVEVEKEADIRIFYWFGNLYSMAIMSQSNEQTKTDFRKYPSNNRNRSIPFSVPDEVKMKLINLMSQLNLETGSIDMILTLKGEFVFLEVNPVGQYDMTSVPCNYYLDKLIALKLIELANYQYG